MSRQLGTFFVILGLIGLILFFASVMADQTLCNIGLLSAASILLGIFFITRKPKTPVKPS
jgi:multisubunit Na+/H+ antiporter MnhG subunit